MSETRHPLLDVFDFGDRVPQGCVPPKRGWFTSEDRALDDVEVDYERALVGESTCSPEGLCGIAQVPGLSTAVKLLPVVQSRQAKLHELAVACYELAARGAWREQPERRRFVILGAGRPEP